MLRNEFTTPPSSETIRAFFRDQRTQSVARVAELVGWPRAQVKRRAVEDEALLHGDYVPWVVAAAWVFETWSYQWVMQTLGADAELLPGGLQVTPVTWYAPFYIVHALNLQRRIEPLPHRTVRPHDLSDYLTDVLHRSIDPDTIDVLRRDPAFMRSYAFMEGDHDA